MHIVDPAEEDFPFAGRTRFESARGDESEIFGRAETVRAAYRTRFRAHGEAVAELARRLGWSCLVHRTDKRPETALIALFMPILQGRTPGALRDRLHEPLRRIEFRRALAPGGAGRRCRSIWWLLRVTPPAPRRVVFPPFRLLLGLEAPQETPARTPWWLLLLRLIAAASSIVALAEPTIGRATKGVAHGPLVLFVDNGWTAAQLWRNRDAAISEALADAANAGRAVAIVPTASVSKPLVSLLDAGEAEREARALEPQAYCPTACARRRPSPMRISQAGRKSSG